MNEAEKKLRDEILEYAAGKHVVEFNPGPDAPDIIIVDIYDVDPQLRWKVRKDLWEIIDKHEDSIPDAAYVPSIIDHEDTLKNYPEKLNKKA